MVYYNLHLSIVPLKGKTMAKKPLISANELSFQRQGNIILEHVDIKIAPDDFLTIVGPNGAGKTTLLKILIGIMPPSSGSISHREGLKIGYVPQRLQPDPVLPITAHYFLSLAEPEDKRDIDEVLEITGIAGLKHRLIHTLSGGEMQRLMLARALVKRPDILALDEPAQNLDVKGELELYQLIHKLHKEKQVAVVMVSHDLHMVMASTKRVLCLFHHVCCWGTPEKVAKHPVFKQVFGEDITRMMAFYQHSHHHEHDLHHPNETIKSRR
jgi:zinc transport system ATP-binding protein